MLGKKLTISASDFGLQHLYASTPWSCHHNPPPLVYRRLVECESITKKSPYILRMIQKFVLEMMHYGNSYMYMTNELQ